MIANPVVTIDVDWAPEAAIDLTRELLVDRQVAATWMVTHRSPAIGRLERHPELFELGIHPNFLAGSSHGDSPGEVLRHCMELVPDATTMRTHCLYQHSRLHDLVLETTPVRLDLSLFLPRTPHLAPVMLERVAGTLVRLPYVWEDDYEMACSAPQWDVDQLASTPGLKVVDFHPIHVFLNSPDAGPYESLLGTGKHLPTCGALELSSHVHHGLGTRTFFEDLLDHLADAGSMTAHEVAQRWHTGTPALPA